MTKLAAATRSLVVERVMPHPLKRFGAPSHKAL